MAVPMLLARAAVSEPPTRATDARRERLSVAAAGWNRRLRSPVGHISKPAPRALVWSPAVRSIAADGQRLHDLVAVGVGRLPRNEGSGPACSKPRLPSSPPPHSPPTPVERTTGARRALGSVHEA